ncbi:hypothetical protein C8R45DRAFT_809415, partial [Mycena sanguinolenta]
VNFPSFQNLPSEHDLDDLYYTENGTIKSHWCFLAEIKENLPWIRPMVYIEDKSGEKYLVAFHLDDRSRFQAVAEKCRNGHTICIMDAEQHLFGDGQIGVRVEDERAVKILPCGLKELFKLGAKVASGEGVCGVCGDSATLKCSRCKLFYCGKTCQIKDWNGLHKKECKIAQQVVEWGALDWNQFAKSKAFAL